MSGKYIYMTPDGLKKLEDELEYLCKVKRKEIARQIREALDEGDEIDDNVAFEVAKNEQAFMENLEL